MGRQEFLHVLGVVGVASFLALANASKSLAESLAISDDTMAEEAESQTTSNTLTSSNQSSSLSTSSNCTVRCGKACSYPGHCHRYIDTNNNNRCDFGECV